MYDTDVKAFDWSQFRVLARLERKTDESLERYFNSFVNMCRTACKLPPRKDEGILYCQCVLIRLNIILSSLFFHTSFFFPCSLFTTLTFPVVVAVDQAVFVEPLTEERAARTLYRIELLRKIREQVQSKGCGWTCSIGGWVGVCCGRKIS